jgi:hypothetical protein
MLKGLMQDFPLTITALMRHAESQQALIEEESVNLSAGVPTVWLNLLNYLRDTGKPIASLQRMIVGGSACPLSIMERFERPLLVAVKEEGSALTRSAYLGSGSSPPSTITARAETVEADLSAILPGFPVQ